MSETVFEIGQRVRVDCSPGYSQFQGREGSIVDRSIHPGEVMVEMDARPFWGLGQAILAFDEDELRPAGPGMDRSRP